jgi:hypothetical protein
MASGSGTTPAGESPGVADADASPPVHKHVEPPTPDKARFAYLTACSDASEKCAATLPAIRQYAGLRTFGYDPETSWSSYAKSIWLAACSRNIDLASDGGTRLTQVVISLFPVVLREIVNHMLSVSCTTFSLPTWEALCIVMRGLADDPSFQQVPHTRSRPSRQSNASPPPSPAQPSSSPPGPLPCPSLLRHGAGPSNQQRTHGKQAGGKR